MINNNESQRGVLLVVYLWRREDDGGPVDNSFFLRVCVSDMKCLMLEIVGSIINSTHKTIASPFSHAPHRNERPLLKLGRILTYFCLRRFSFIIFLHSYKRPVGNFELFFPIRRWRCSDDLFINQLFVRGLCCFFLFLPLRINRKYFWICENAIT